MKFTIPAQVRVPALVLVALALPFEADACSCRVEPLAERYEQASVVFVARIGKGFESYDESGLRTLAWSFKVADVLKGDVTFDVLVRGNCGGDVIEGEEFLIFTNNLGQVGSCTSGNLSQNERYRADLEVLRHYRDGDLQAIAEPWVYTKRSGKCSLSLDMTQGHGSLSVEYRFADADARWFRDQQFHYDISERRTVKLEGLESHPAHFAGFRRIRIWYPYSHYKVEGSGRLIIGGEEWPTEYLNMEAPVSPFEVVFDSDFNDVIAAVKSHHGLSLSAEYENFPYNLNDFPDFPVIKAETPDFYRGTAIEKFEQCMDRAGQ